MSYEQQNWAKLSPQFREAHNRLRVARGLPPIPAPAVDLYVKPPATTAAVRPVDNMRDPEAVGAMREFLGPRMMGGGDEGFAINGMPAIAQAAAVVTGLESKKRLLIEKQAGLEDQRRP
jgi:hypothetical protein